MSLQLVKNGMTEAVMFSPDGKNILPAKTGEVAAILPGETYSITTTQNVLAYKAFVP